MARRRPANTLVRSVGGIRYRRDHGRVHPLCRRPVSATGWTPTGHIGNIELALRPLHRLYARTLANEFNCVMLRACAVEAIADSIRPDPKTGKPRRQKPLARRVANQRARLIRRMFRWAAGRRLVDPYVPEGLTNYEALYAGEQLEIDGRTITAQDPILDLSFRTTNTSEQSNSVHLWCELLETLRHTGARLSEVVSIRTADINRTGSTWVYRPRWHKNFRRGLPREIQIGPRTQKVLRPWLRPECARRICLQSTPDGRIDAGATHQQRLKQRPKAKGNRKKAKAKPRRLPGERYSRNSLLHAVICAAEKAGVRPWSPVSYGIFGRLNWSSNTMPQPLLPAWAMRPWTQRSTTTSSWTRIRRGLRCSRPVS